MTRSIIKLAPFFTLAIVALIASPAKADVYNDIDRSARKIQRKTKSLLNETIHYRHTPQYTRLVRCTSELKRLATHIHDVTHFEGNLIHLRADLRDLDTEFHALEGLFDQIEEAAAYGHGRVQGNTAHVKSLLNSIEDCIHHIQDDVDTLVAPTVCPRTVVVPKPVVVARPVVVTRPVIVPTRSAYPVKRGGISINIGGSDYNANRNGYGYSRGRGQSGRTRQGCGNNGGIGISLGGGSSRLTFGF